MSVIQPLRVSQNAIFIVDVDVWDLKEDNL